METNEEVMEKQKTKTSKGVVAALIIVILLLLGAVGYIVYDKVFANQSKVNENQVTNTTNIVSNETNTTNVNTVENTTEAKVPMADLTAYSINPEYISLHYIEDGYIYSYYSAKQSENEVDKKIFIDYDGSDSTPYVMKKYEALSNVKRLKTFNKGSSVQPFRYAITEDGKVYWPGYDKDGKEAPEQEMELSAYKVDDILDYESSELGTTWKIKLQDGTTKTIERRSSAYNEIMEEINAQQ